MGRSTLFLTLIGIGLLVFIALLSQGFSSQRGASDKQQLVFSLGLTDLALFSEARYTRHPSQADLFSAFQDSPAAFEHFPSGSLIAPAPIGHSRRIDIRKNKERQTQ